MKLDIIKKTGILSEAEEFSKVLLNLSLEQLIEIATSNLKNTKERLAYRNVENIENGISGYLFFLLEFYKYSKQDVYLSKAESLANCLLIYCFKNPTNNYSFYSGRSGFLYFLLQLYEINKNELLIEKCEQLLISCEDDYLESTYTSDYLYNGRAGTLMVLTELFKKSQSEKTLQLINKFVNKIIENAVLTETGISWKAKEELNLRNSCGFAMGASGIQYVLKNLNSVMSHQSLNYIIDEIDKYKDSCWDKKKQNWSNFEKDIINSSQLAKYKNEHLNNQFSIYTPSTGLFWSSGAVGILQSCSDDQKYNFNFNVEALNDLPRNIFEGLSGIGLYLLQNNDSESQRLNMKIIVDQILARKMTISLTDGFLFGEMGVNYFLLKCHTMEEFPQSIINPMLNKVIDKVNYSLEIDIKIVKKQLLSTTYGRTIEVLDKIFRENLENYLSDENCKTGLSEIKRFENFVYQNFVLTNTPIHNVIQDIFNFEKERKNFLYKESRSSLNLYIEKLIYNDKIIKLLNHKDEFILDQKVKIIENLKSVVTKWDWDSDPRFNLIQNFYNDQSHYEFLLLPSYEYGLNEYALKIDGLILHRFDSPKKISEALNEIKIFCKSQPENVVKAFLTDTGSTNVEDFIERLDFLVLHKVKQLIYDGILEII